MTLVIALMITALAWFTVVKPWREYSAAAAEREMRRTYARFQAVMVAKYHPAFKEYPELRRLSLDEVKRIFDTERAYHELRVAHVESERFF